MDSIAKPPVVPDARVVIGFEGVDPAKLQLPLVMGVPRDQSTGSHFIFEGLVVDVSVDASFPDVRDQL